MGEGVYVKEKISYMFGDEKVQISTDVMPKWSHAEVIEACCFEDEMTWSDESSIKWPASRQ